MNVLELAVTDHIDRCQKGKPVIRYAYAEGKGISGATTLGAWDEKLGDWFCIAGRLLTGEWIPMPGNLMIDGEPVVKGWVEMSDQVYEKAGIDAVLDALVDAAERIERFDTEMYADAPEWPNVVVAMRQAIGLLQGGINAVIEGLVDAAERVTQLSGDIYTDAPECRQQVEGMMRAIDLLEGARINAAKVLATRKVRA